MKHHFRPLGAEFVAAGDLIGRDFERLPNMNRWLGTMRALPSQKQVNQAVDGFAALMKGKEFVAIA